MFKTSFGEYWGKEVEGWVKPVNTLGYYSQSPYISLDAHKEASRVAVLFISLTEYITYQESEQVLFWVGGWVGGWII